MKRFDVSTKFESNTEYRLDSDTLRVDLSDTVRLEDKIYRAIYMSPKTRLDTAIYLKDLLVRSLFPLLRPFRHPFAPDPLDNRSMTTVL